MSTRLSIWALYWTSASWAICTSWCIFMPSSPHLLVASAFLENVKKLKSVPVRNAELEWIVPIVKRTFPPSFPLSVFLPFSSFFLFLFPSDRWGGFFHQNRLMWMYHTTFNEIFPQFHTVQVDITWCHRFYPQNRNSPRSKHSIKIQLTFNIDLGFLSCRSDLFRISFSFYPICKLFVNCQMTEMKKVWPIIDLSGESVLLYQRCFIFQLKVSSRLVTVSYFHWQL